MELDLSRRLCEPVPGAKLVGITMTGSEMVQAALRLTHAATRRSRIVKFAGHYHGWFDHESAVEQAVSRYGGLDCIVASAAIQRFGKLADTRERGLG